MNKQRRADLLLVMTTFFWGASYYLISAWQICRP